MLDVPTTESTVHDLAARPTARAGVGFSSRVAEIDAVAEAVDIAMAEAGGNASVVIAYAGVAYDIPRLAKHLSAAIPGAPILGCSAQGCSLRNRSVETDRFVSVAVMSGDLLRVKTAQIEDLRPDARGAGRSIAEQLGAPDTRFPNRSTSFLWYDPLGGADIQATIRGMSEGPPRAIYGGAAGQPWGRMVETYQWLDDRVFTRGAVAMMLEGPELVADFTHGAEALGLDLTVTRSDANVIWELDGRPALDVWCEQLGVTPEKDVENTSNWALGIKPPAGVSYEGFVTRAPFGLDQERKTLVLQAAIPEGSRVHVCIRTQSAVYDGAMAMSDRLQTRLASGKPPFVALSFECGARPAPFLGTELATQEIREIQRKIGANIPWTGLYAWGEIAPVGAVNDFHNFTFPLCLLREPA